MLRIGNIYLLDKLYRCIDRFDLDRSQADKPMASGKGQDNSDLLYSLRTALNSLKYIFQEHIFKIHQMHDQSQLGLEGKIHHLLMRIIQLGKLQDW